MICACLYVTSLLEFGLLGVLIFVPIYVAIDVTLAYLFKKTSKAS